MREYSYSLTESYADALRRVHTEQCRAISEHAIYVHIQDVLEVAHFLSTTDIRNNDTDSSTEASIFCYFSIIEVRIRLDFCELKIWET